MHQEEEAEEEEEEEEAKTLDTEISLICMPRRQKRITTQTEPNTILNE